MKGQFFDIICKVCLLIQFSFFLNSSTCFWLMFPFCIFQKHQKTFSFFSEGIKQKEPEMGWLIVKTHQLSNTSCRKKVPSRSSKKYALRFWLINIFPLTHQRPKKPPEGFYKKRCSSKFHWFYRKSPVLESGLQFCYKRDSSTGVFLWILRNFEEHLLAASATTNLSVI